MRSAIAAGLSVHGIRVDPVSGEYTLLVGDPASAKAGAKGADVDPDRELQTVPMIEPVKRAVPGEGRRK
jgi:hypothetical protein